LFLGLVGCGSSDGSGDVSGGEAGEGGPDAPTDGAGESAGEGGADVDGDGSGAGEGGADAGNGEEGGGLDTIEVEIPDQGNFTPADIAEARIDGEKVEFGSYAKASFIELPEQGPVLQLVLSEGLTQVEIQIPGVESDWTGNVSTAGGGNAAVLYNDGTLLGDAQFLYGAGGEAGGDYDITIIENGGPGTRLVGTFSATLNLLVQSDKAPTLVITQGEFDVGYDD
jgi:hypothetical protein